jgi:hypothetical protein
VNTSKAPCCSQTAFIIGCGIPNRFPRALVRGGLGGVVLASPEYTLYVSDPFQKNPKIAISRVLHGKPTPLALKTKKRSMKITDRFFTFLRAS